tara:strand:- start:166 stop:342 length:177 start_codon:yes stop_codon:yes gene_type:complete
MYDKQLSLMPILNGCVQINKSALTDPAIMATLQTLEEKNYDLYRTPFGETSWNISDYD